MRLLLCVVLTVFAVTLSKAQVALKRENTVPMHPLEFESIDGPRGEVVLSIVCTEQGVLLAGTRGRGVMRSTDSGDSWTQTSLRNEAVWPLYVTPGGHILAFLAHHMLGDVDVLLSTDSGEHWQLVPDSSRKYYGRAVVRMTNDAIYSEGGGGLHRSTDDGRSWVTLQTTPPMERCDVDYELVVLSDSVLFAQCYQGMFRSGDGGRTWQKLALTHTGFHGLIRDPSGGVFVVARDISIPNTTVLIRLASDGTTIEMIGADLSWLSETITSVLASGAMLYGSQSNPRGIFRSVDSARTWAATSVLSGVVNDFCQAPDGTVYAAMHGTIYRSFDDGMNWEECSNGLAKRVILHLFKDADGGMYAGTELGGLYVSSDDGRSWRASTTGLCSVSAGFSSGPGHVLLGTMSARPNENYTITGGYHVDWISGGYSMRISRDSARTWMQPRMESILPWGLWRIIPGEGMRAYGSGRDLIISDDGGETWRKDPTFSGSWDLHANLEGLYILRNDSVFFRASDDDPWRAVRAETDVWAVGGSADAVVTFDRNSIARSKDIGVHWETLPISGDELYNPKFVSVSPYATVLVGDSYACYLTTDKGRAWHRIVPGEDRLLRITSAVMDAENHLLIGSSNGLYRSTNPLPGSYTAHRFSLGVPWPNPVVSDLTIPYSLQEDGYVRLTLNDVAGRELVVLFEGHRNAGQYFEWVSGFLSEYMRVGLYFCNLSVNGRVQTRPLVFP